ncbi:hypothetical protein [Saccharothrix sp. Mg75]|uniref:hypothetical protein n=1 Tax=Saccharothrix sp. Mg75 TaxID=3445357 RepID=UPI003EED5290
MDRELGEQHTKEGLREAVHAEAPAIRDAVLEALAFDPNTLKDVASDDHLDRVATNAIALRLKDNALARDLYTDLRDQVIHAPERWYDVKTSVSLSPWSGGPATGRGSMFVATVRWEYRVQPAGGTMRFACVNDQAEYREMLRDPSVTSAWYFGQSSGLDAASPDAYELTSFSVDGKEKAVRRTSRSGAQVYAVNLGRAHAGRGVTVAYTYRVLVQRHGHLLYLDLPRPTKGFHVQFDYGQVGIRRINTLDFFASSQASRVEHSRRTDEPKTVNISFDGWMLPRAGVAFVWVLEEELEVQNNDHA